MRASTMVLSAFMVIAGSAMARAADVVVVLDGEAAFSGAPLGAEVAIDIESPHSAVLHVTNTSPQTSPKLKGAPVLEQLAWNLVDGPKAGCFKVEADGPKWWLTGGAKPLCGKVGPCKWSSKGKKGWWFGKKKGWWYGKLGGPWKSFDYGLFSGIPLFKKALGPGETVDIRLTVKPKCQKKFAFTPEVFTDAPDTKVGGAETQWAAAFLGAGKYGFDFGCALGDAEPVAPPEPACTPVFTWSSFTATAGDMNGLPSVDNPNGSDGRAGSADMAFTGGWGWDALTTDPPFAAAVVTLKNGKSGVLEQWHLNRRWPGGEGCAQDDPDQPWKCWLSAATDLVDGVLAAVTPSFVGSSNAGFDDSGLRVEVSADVTVDFSQGDAFADNGHETLTVTWTAPLGIDTAQLLLRGRYDANLDGLDGQDEMIVLLSRNVGAEPDVIAPSVLVVEETETVLKIAVNVQAGLEDVCVAYDALGMLP